MTTSPGVTPDRVAVVTGGSRGIGGATACWLAGVGYTVVVGYAHDQAAADAVVESILDEHGAAITLRADVTDEMDVDRLFVETVDAFGGVDAVVHAVVGPVMTKPVASVTAGEFDALHAINSKGVFLVNRQAARHVRRGGVIVNLTSSLVGWRVGRHGAQIAARSGTDVLTRVLSVELADRDISVNAIALDLDGPCEPDRVADAVAFLVSERGHRVTGQVIRVDDPRRDLDGRRNGDGPGLIGRA
jgi:3-oxoacyl-[acyl-carrier protein] reductase